MTTRYHDIAEAYAAHCANHSPLSAWAQDEMWSFMSAGCWEDVWGVLLAFAHSETAFSDEVMAVVAAGPLEDLVCSAVAPDFIDRIEQEARSNPRMGRLLTGVWPRAAEQGVKERVIRFCRAFPDPIDEEYGF